MPRQKNNHRRCQQTKCAYFLKGNCQNCEDCKAEPYLINTHCTRCIACEGKEDELRWGEKIAKKERNMQPLRLTPEEQAIINTVLSGAVKRQLRQQEQPPHYERPIER